MTLLRGVDKEIDDYYKKLKHILILGSEAFTKTVTEKYLKEEHKIKEIPEHKQVIHVPQIEEIIQIVADYYGVTKDSIRTVKKRHGNLPRAVVMYLSQVLGQHKLETIAVMLTGTAYSGVSWMSRQIMAKVDNDKNLARDIERLKKRLLEADKSKIET